MANIKYIERQKKIYEESKNFLQERFIENKNAVLECMNRAENKKHVVDIFNQVCIKGKELQKNDKKDPIEYICIHFLRSSILTKTFDVEISLYDSQYYFDLDVVTEVWSPKWIVPYWENDIKQLANYLNRKVERFHKGELEKISLDYGIWYYQWLFVFVKSCVMDFIHLDSYNKLLKTDTCKIWMGEIYLDRTVLYDCCEGE